ncbi:MAG: PHB depolymerase family esterase [Rubrivivax sp.]|nr:PHB depolymerase family esterase [Rubrivivax sp.]
MKPPFKARAPSFDADAINATIQRALASAGLDTASGPMQGVTETLRRALAAGRLGGAASHPSQQGPDRFEAREFSNDAGSRGYKVYVPAVQSDAPRAMVVMLHGCTQSADDFAAGTQMNRLADEHGFLVVYPEQAAQANASKCWNWFQPQDQMRGRGEPALIAGIVREVAKRQGADLRRIFVAGLSAGAAMAVVLGETYPELFAGVGAHSGLPYGSAHDIPSALAAMKGGRGGLPGLKSRAAAGPPRSGAVKAVPVIVFHGDRDHTVQQGNGAQIVQQARDAHAAQAGDAGLRVSTQAGVSVGGRRFSRTVHTDTDGRARIESWTLHGAGHAWSGGHASGSFIDSTGPAASAEMVRFFLDLPAAGSA